jgi:hypothetical protein
MKMLRKDLDYQFHPANMRVPITITGDSPEREGINNRNVHRQAGRQAACLLQVLMQGLRS